MTEPCNFSLSHYREVLTTFLNTGYIFMTFSEYLKCVDIPDRFILMRHDIDKSVTKALRMAQIEHDLGIKSSYYVRLHSNYYNPFGHVCYRQLQEIVHLGHKIGLHTEFYDASRIAGESAEAMFLREVTIFENIFQSPCETYSLHRTTGSSNLEDIQEMSRQFLKSQGIYGTQHSCFSEGVKFISDSSGIWREGCMCNHVGKHNRFHILTHPDWWYENFIELEEPVV